MPYIRGALVAVASLITACSPAPSPSQAPDATGIRAIVETIYAQYLDEDLRTGDVPLVDAAPWSAATRARLAEAETLDQTILVFNPLTESQEDIIENVRVGQPAIRADGTASVDVRFILGDERVQQHDFIREDGAWRLHNIRADEWTLDALLTEAIAEGRANAPLER
ncbi:MAG: hypothetical protein AB7J28_04380 [Hyphomonadaceae bacterium]